MWRWSLIALFLLFAIKVFSTYVEMILPLSIFHSLLVGILHVCGDDPEATAVLAATKEVFSTYVEMILRKSNNWKSLNSILHVCGDDPISNWDITVNIEYSPRMWRWSLTWYISQSPITVFSTYVEMILVTFEQMVVILSILHVCGDDPNMITITSEALRYSPRMWRWS